MPNRSKSKILAYRHLDTLALVRIWKLSSGVSAVKLIPRDSAAVLTDIPVMSSIAILSDIHGNLPAFEAVVREAQQLGVERFAFLGDIVGYGASPAECLALVRKLGGPCVMGNHDEAIEAVRRPGFRFYDPEWQSRGYQAGLAHAAKELSDAQAAWLAALPFTTTLPGAVAAHASLYQPQAFPFINDAASALPTLELLRERQNKVGFFGHTHVTGIFSDRDGLLDWLDDSRVQIPACLACVVMTGAVGQPNHPTDRRACWVLWDADERLVEFHKTEYDRIQAARNIVNAGLPMESAEKLLTDDDLSLFQS